MLISSIKPTGKLYSVPPTLLPRPATLVHYANVILESNIPRYFINSMVVATGSTGIALCVAVVGSYGFARFSFPGRIFLKTAVLTSQMVPTAAIIVPLFVTLRVLGLINTYWGLILCYLILTLPLSVWMMTSYFVNIPYSMEECAQLDGASRVRILLQIVVPVSLPGIVATVIYCFVVAWNEFIFALSFAQDTSVKTLPIGLAEFIQEFETDWGALMAGSVLMTLPIVVVFFLLQRYFIAGLSQGSTK
jgi:ABC-type glycerol-3-phosphate transport system permease component